jgi:hypothetical protein
VSETTSFARTRPQASPSATGSDGFGGVWRAMIARASETVITAAF